MPRYANIHNAHTGNMLSSNQGMLQGCSGCKGGGVVQARGIVGHKGGKSRRRRRRSKRRKKHNKGRGTKQHRRRRGRRGGKPFGSLTRRQQNRVAKQGAHFLLKRGQLGGNSAGNGYGLTSATANTAAHQGMGYGSTPMASYKNCALFPSFKMGAGQPYSSISAMQKGAGKNLSNAGYGYTGGDVKSFAGSYPPISSTSYEQRCLQRGGAVAKRKRKKSKIKKPVSPRRAPSQVRADGPAQATGAELSGMTTALPSPSYRELSKSGKDLAQHPLLQKVREPHQIQTKLSNTAVAANAASANADPVFKSAARQKPETSADFTAKAIVSINKAAPLLAKAARTLAKARAAKTPASVAGTYAAPGAATTKKKGRRKEGGSRIHRLASAVAQPFEAVAEAGRNAVRDFTQSSTMSTLTYPSQAGGRRRSRRNKRKRGRKSRRRRPRRPRRPRRRQKRNTRHRRKRKKTRHRKRQRGGYAQYQGNLPLTSTSSLPAGAAGGTWTGQLASPPTYSRVNNCNNNYNHWTGNNTPSPVLDGAAPSLPSLGGN